MRYFVDPERGLDALAGHESEAWQSLGAAAERLKQGDELFLMDGEHQGELIIAVSDVTVQAQAAAAVLEGGSGRLTGWTASSLGPNIYQRQVSFTALGVFIDSFDGTDGMGDAIGRDAVLWNMAADNNYGSNPNHEMHDYQASHDQYLGRAGDKWRMHDWHSQWIQKGSMLYVRTVDGKSPDAHNCRAAVKKVAISAGGQANVVFDGVTAQHFGSFTSILNCPGAVVKNSRFQYCGGYGLEIHGSDNAVVEKCIIRGGGSGVAHGGQSGYFSNESGLRFENNDVRYGGHGGPFGKALQKYVIRGNFFGKAQGSLLNLNYGSNDGVVESNVFVGAPYQFESLIHKEPHAAVQLIGSRNVFRNNLVSHCGVGFALDTGNGGVSANNLFERNTIHGSEILGMTLNQGTHDNILRANVIVGGDILVRLDLPGGGANSYFGCRLEGNLLFGGKIHLFDDGVLDPMVMQSKKPGVMSGNKSADPQFVDPAGGDFHLKPGSPAAGLGSTLTDARPPGGIPVPPPPSPGGAMKLDSISPQPAKVGDTITLTGSGFQTAPYVLFPDPDLPGGLRVPTASSSDTSATVKVPEGVGNGQLRMRTNTVPPVYSNYLPFSVGGAPPPPPPPQELAVTITAAATSSGGTFAGTVADRASLIAGTRIDVAILTPDGRSATGMATITGPGPPPPPSGEAPEVAWEAKGTPEEQALLLAGLRQISFPWSKLLPGLAARGISKITCEFADLSVMEELLTRVDGQRLTRFTAETLGIETSGDDPDHWHATWLDQVPGLPEETRRYIAGLASPGRIRIERRLKSEPNTVAVVVSAEAAHEVMEWSWGTDAMRSRLLQITNDPQPWWHGDYSSLYFEQGGENFMAGFGIAYRSGAVEDHRFAHWYTLDQGDEIRQILGLERMT